MQISGPLDVIRPKSDSFPGRPTADANMDYELIPESMNWPSVTSRWLFLNMGGIFA